MQWETFLRLEQKDVEANREKICILSGQITAIEAEIGKLPADPATTCWRATVRFSRPRRDQSFDHVACLAPIHVEEAFSNVQWLDQTICCISERITMTGQ
jgi:hypothetical protein